MKILLLLALLMTTSTFAEDYVHLGMWSKHADSGLNETHDLVGIEVDGYFIHRFENSKNSTAYYIGSINRDFYCIDLLCMGYSVGLIQGYDFKRVTPMGFGVISFGHNGIGADIEILPGEVYALRLRFSGEVFNKLDFNPPWDTEGYVELSLDHFDPDGEGSLGFDRNNGAAYDVKFYLNEDVFIKGNYTQTDFGAQPDQGDEKFTPVWSTGYPSQVSSTGYIEVGKDFDSFSISASYNQISIQENTLNRNTMELSSIPNKHHRGFGFQISTDFQISEDFGLEFEVALIDNIIQDLRLTGRVVYQLTDDFDFVFKIIDRERFNYTQLQAGIRYTL